MNNLFKSTIPFAVLALISFGSTAYADDEDEDAEEGRGMKESETVEESDEIEEGEEIEEGGGARTDAGARQAQAQGGRARAAYQSSSMAT